MMTDPPSIDRQTLRIVSTAWGENYVSDFLEFCLPALLAPNNVPALVEHFDRLDEAVGSYEIVMLGIEVAFH